jgi:hypothetical protein
MAFLQEDPESIPVGKAEKSEAAQQKLTAFRSKIQGTKHVKYWSSPEELAGKVALSFSQFTKNYPAVGWVRADQQATSEALAEANELRKRIADMQLALDEARTSPPAGTEMLSQGEDKFSIWLDYELKYQTPGATGRRLLSRLVEVETSWNAVFSAMGPRMLDESPEDALHEQVNEWVLTNFPADVRDHALKEIRYSGDPNRVKFYDYSVIVPNEDFHTILVQLMALGAWCPMAFPPGR